MEAHAIDNSLAAEKDLEKHKEHCFTFFVDDRQFQVEPETITGLEIMNLAGIPREVGILFIAEDGSQVSVQPEEVITLERCKHFKKAPRFRRG
jgi:hypothetical protein